MSDQSLSSTAEVSQDVLILMPTVAALPTPMPPMAPPRPSLARKRRAPAALSLPIVDSPPVLTTRVPSSLSLSSETSVDSSSDDDASADSQKRMRHDSTVSMLSDDLDSQNSLSGDFNYYCSGSCSSASVRSTGGRREAVVPLLHNSVVGEYKIVGSGRETKAVHMFTSEVFDAKVLTESEALSVSRIVCRLDDARRFYFSSDINEMRNAVFAEKAEVVEEMSGRIVMFTPVYQKTLHSFAQERNVHISEAELQPIFEQIIRIVAFCHTIGIIVRDVKPKKLVLDKTGKIRLSHVADCVVCDDPENDLQQGKIGSPAYTTPEVLSSHGLGYSGRAADMWGMGVLFYLLLLGRYPFFDKTPVGVFQKIKQARVIVPKEANISRYARILLFNLMRKCPRERPTAVDLSFMQWTGASDLPSRGRTERVIHSLPFNEFALPFPESAIRGRSAVSPLSAADDIRRQQRQAALERYPALESIRNIMMSTRTILAAMTARVSE